MPKFDGSEARVGYAYVSAFTLHEDRLALLTIREDERQSLPREIIRQDQTTDQAAEAAFAVAFGDAQPTIEPFMGWSQNKAMPSAILNGYTAVTRLTGIQGSENIQPIPVQHLTDSAVGLSEVETDFVDWGLKTLRPYELGDWNFYLDDYLEPDFAMRILSRLVGDPSRFIISELRIAFEAFLSAPRPGQTREQHKINAPNFHKAMDTKLVPTGEYIRPPKGRPAQLYSMQPHILDPANSTRWVN